MLTPANWPVITGSIILPAHRKVAQGMKAELDSVVVVVVVVVVIIIIIIIISRKNSEGRN